ncbi:MAG: hypothetical protein WC451_05505 [Patescibacteria group bacterium]
MNVTDFKIEDYDNMKVKPDSWCDRRLIEAYALAGTAWTLWADDKIILCGGLVPGGWPGVADVWIAPSIFIDKYPLAAVKYVRGYLDKAIEVYGLWRVQATIAAEHCKWIELMGFQKEGLLRKFSPDKQDRFIYSRV